MIIGLPMTRQPFGNPKRRGVWDISNISERVDMQAYRRKRIQRHVVAPGHSFSTLVNTRLARKDDESSRVA